MNRYLALGLAVGITAAVASARDVEMTTVTEAGAPAGARRATTATQRLNENVQNTTAAEAVAPHASEAMFQRQWQREESLYRQAGISEEKIEQLRDLSQETWDARARGEKLNFQELNRKRSDILDQDDMAKLRDVRRAAINDALDPDDAKSTKTVTE